MQYRPHIDGLRTLAVVPVVLFHVGFPTLPGGFVGVDVFFVISGYLITSVLLGDLERKQFSIARFYQRRILRLLPALFAVLVGVWIASSFLYFRPELESVGWQILAAATFSSNFYFWQQDGYFTATAEAQPLLHTWSLAVEEQFYIIFPILMYLLFRFARRRISVVLLAATVVSFVGCVAITYVSESTAFFMLPTRAWELGVGALLAVLGTKMVRGRWAHSLGIIGFVLIAGPMLFYHEGSPAFPGWSAALPVVGAALLIGWGSGGMIGRLLSSGAMVYVGRISYSVYLWHWPLIVFWKAATDPILDAWEMAFLFLGSLALGALSMKFIEQPFRSRKVRTASPRRVIAIGTIGLILVAGIGVVQIRTPVSLVNASASAIRTADFVDYVGTDDHQRQFREGSCFLSGYADGGSYDSENCARVVDSRANVLLLGDSHAAQYGGALTEILGNANVMQTTISGCRPLVGSSGTPECVALRDWALEEFLPSNKVDAIVLGGRWREDELSFVRPTIEYLKQFTRSVIVIGPTVEYESVFPILVARSETQGRDLDFDTIRTPGRDEVDHGMKAAVEAAGAHYVDVLATECPTTTSCVVFAPDGVPLQFDYGHLTLSGSKFVLDPHAEELRSLIIAAP